MGHAIMVESDCGTTFIDLLRIKRIRSLLAYTIAIEGASLRLFGQKFVFFKRNYCEEKVSNLKSWIR